MLNIRLTFPSACLPHFEDDQFRMQNEAPQHTDQTQLLHRFRTNRAPPALDKDYVQRQDSDIQYTECQAAGT